MDLVTIICAVKNGTLRNQVDTIVPGTKWRVTNKQAIAAPAKKSSWGVGKYARYEDVNDKHEVGMITESTEVAPGEFDIVVVKTDGIANENARAVRGHAKQAIVNSMNVPAHVLMGPGTGQEINGEYVMPKKVQNRVTYWPQPVMDGDLVANHVPHEPVAPEPAPEAAAPQPVAPDAAAPEPEALEPAAPGPSRGSTHDDSVLAGIDFLKAKFSTLATSTEVSNLAERNVIKINQIETHVNTNLTEIYSRIGALEAFKAEQEIRNVDQDTHNAAVLGMIANIKEALSAIVDKVPELEDAIARITDLELAVKLIQNPGFLRYVMSKLGQVCTMIGTVTMANPDIRESMFKILNDVQDAVNMQAASCSKAVMGM
jgi:hypothetical protein